MPRDLVIDVRVGGKHRNKDWGEYVVGLGQFWRRVKVESLRAFAKEVRRRARIRLAVNRSPYPSGSDHRYVGALRDDIHFRVTDDSVAFEVGRNRPYAVVEDQAKGEETHMVGNPTMRFFWYRHQKPLALSRPVAVRRTGKAFFTGSLYSAMDDLEKIMNRSYEKERRKARKK